MSWVNIVSMLFLLLCACASAQQSGLRSTTMTLAGDVPTLQFAQTPNSYSFQLTPSGPAFLHNGAPMLSVDPQSNIVLNVTNVRVDALDLSGPSFLLSGISQWRLVQVENFQSPTGWSNNTNSVCAGTYMLGGYCMFSIGQVSKTFTSLPAHTSLKIQASFHFIDAWTGESAYLMASMDSSTQYYVWADTYRAGQASSAINMCGARYGEAKFLVPIDVVIPHSSDSVTLTFGTTLDQDPCDESWGVSKLHLLVR